MQRASLQGCCKVVFHVLLVIAGAGAAGAQTRQLQDHRTHTYKNGELVVLYANKVGPFHNPRYGTILSAITDARTCRFHTNC